MYVLNGVHVPNHQEPRYIAFADGAEGAEGAEGADGADSADAADSADSDTGTDTDSGQPSPPAWGGLVMGPGFRHRGASLCRPFTS